SAFLGDQLSGCAGAARHLGSPAGTKFDIVDRLAEWNIPQRQCVSDEDIGFRTGDNGHAHFQSDRLEDGSTIAIRIAEERDESGAVWIVFNGFHFGRNADLVAAEIDDPVVLLISTSAMPNRQLAVIVAAVNPILPVEKRLVWLIGSEILLVVDDRFESK